MKIAQAISDFIGLILWTILFTGILGIVGITVMGIVEIVEAL